MNSPGTITIVGAGRLASALAPAFINAGWTILQVFSRQPARAALLAGKVGAAPTTDLTSLLLDADVYLLAVSDDAIPEVTKSLALCFQQSSAGTRFPRLVAHCSGSVPMDPLAELAPAACGVFYPVQSFAHGFVPDFQQIPICITGSDLEAERILTHMAQDLGSPTKTISDHQRGQLHLAAVLANNFPNHLFALAAQWLENHQLTLDLIKPLIHETARRALDADPRTTQTGPAVRGDKATMQRHQDLLSSNPELVEIYRVLSKSIRKMRQD